MTSIGFAVMAIVVSPVLLVGIVFVLWYSPAMWRIAILLSSDDVRVRNMFRTRRFTWAEIDRFGWGGRSGKAGGVYLRDGTFVNALALSLPDGNPDLPQEVQHLVLELNEELAGARASAGLAVTNLDFVAPGDFGTSNQVPLENQMLLDVNQATGDLSPERSENE
ncbi:MAG: PH domain-containing protein [Gaiellaceae bacterium]